MLRCGGCCIDKPARSERRVLEMVNCMEEHSSQIGIIIDEKVHTALLEMPIQIIRASH